MFAVIGGTGFREMVGLERVHVAEVETAYGVVTISHGSIDGTPLVFVSRHGSPAHIPPHKINYRAIIQALADVGVTRIIGITAVGSVDPGLSVPEVVIPDQIVDYTWGREHTFFANEIRHIDFTFPYDEPLRQALIAAAQAEQAAHPALLIRDSGVYGATQGPRLETAAEIARMARDGCHIVGMTAMPEVALAKERELAYAGLSIVVNKGAGIEGAVDLDGITEAMAKGMAFARSIVLRAVKAGT